VRVRAEFNVAGKQILLISNAIVVKLSATPAIQ